MRDRLSCSAAGITQVILDDFDDDAKIRGTEGLEEIVVTVKRDGPDEAGLVIDGDTVRARDGFVTRIEVPPGVSVTGQEALGDLKVTRFGGDLRLRSVMGDLRIEEVTGRVEIEHIYGDVRAEDVASMQVLDCDADFRFTGGDVHVETVSGDMRVTDAGSVQSLRVHGDLWLEHLTGGVKVESAHGDVRLADIEGAAGLAMVAGDFRVTNVRGALNVSQVHGDTQLEGPFPAEEGYAVSTMGDASIRVMAEDDVRLVVKALGRVRSNLPLTPNTDGSTTYTATVGEGKVRVVLTANGDLRVEAAGGGREEVRGGWDRKRGPGSDSWGDLSNLGERIRQQVTASLSAAGINPETGEININLGGRRGPRPPRAPEPPRPPRPPEPPRAPQPPQMSAEQLTVLKMLEEGRISPEEADSLLKALGA